MNTSDNYYSKVGSYYDQDVELGFEARADSNESLQRIREAFRAYVVQYEFENALEIGCGPGLDAEWFGKTFKQGKLVAMDVSAKMVESASTRTQEFENVKTIQGTERDLASLDESPFDMIYVFFGALNTVESLPAAANQLFEHMRPGSYAVLTFVNKWYMREMIVNLLKLRFKIAFSRIRKIWGGYSPSRFLASSCYSPGQIRSAFKSFNEVDQHGYSILYPAWYNHHKLQGNPAKGDRLWKLDEQLNNTPFWKFGEYTLFVFQKPLD